MLEIRPVPFAAPDAADLMRQALVDLSERYGGPGDSTPVEPAEFTPPHGALLVAYLDGVPVGCGGWRTLAGDPAVAEIKRMFTVPAARGRGVALAVLRAIEDSARAAGRKRAQLETGTRQPEAIALYERAGYDRVPNFGYYKDYPGCVSFGREL